MQTRNKPPASGRSDGRPPFGLGPIARVQAQPRSPGADQSLGVGPGLAGASRVPRMSSGAGFGLPNLRRNVCPHFYMTSGHGAIPIQAPHLLKALVRHDNTVSRCQLRGGVHMEQGYVNDVCLSPRFNQCVFYEEDLTGE